jgi:hypothetical protein
MMFVFLALIEFVGEMADELLRKMGLLYEYR